VCKSIILFLIERLYFRNLNIIILYMDVLMEDITHNSLETLLTRRIPHGKSSKTKIQYLWNRTLAVNHIITKCLQYVDELSCLMEIMCDNLDAALGLDVDTTATQILNFLNKTKLFNLTKQRRNCN